MGHEGHERFVARRGWDPTGVLIPVWGGSVHGLTYDEAVRLRDSLNALIGPPAPEAPKVPTVPVRVAVAVDHEGGYGAFGCSPHGGESHVSESEDAAEFTWDENVTHRKRVDKHRYRPHVVWVTADVPLPTSAVEVQGSVEQKGGAP